MSELIPQTDITYTPLGESDEITLSRDVIRRFLCTPTKSGKLPEDDQIVRFGMLCKARRLNPWVGDAYLIGYDTKDGPQFSLITAHQALLKRAEACPAYDGLESGIVVQTPQGATEERRGTIAGPKETVLGGWAIAHRSDRSRPIYCSVKLSTYNTGRSRWAADPEGMILKCAEAAALRRAFPLEVGGMYASEELEQTIDGSARPAAGVHRHIEQADRQRDAADGPQTVPEPDRTVDTPAPFEAPQEATGKLSALDETIALIRCARGIREVDQIEAEYREQHSPMGDDDDMRLESAAQETREEIRASRGARSNG